MSTPEQPGGPPLTRKQLRELRKTGQLPVIDPAAAEAASTDAAPGAEAAVEAVGEAVAEEAAPPPPAPTPVIPKAAQPAPLSTAPIPDAQVDLGSRPLTRRQARQQERIRTASVPVITPEAAATAKEAAEAERARETEANADAGEPAVADDIIRSVDVAAPARVEETVEADETVDANEAVEVEESAEVEVPVAIDASAGADAPADTDASADEEESAETGESAATDEEPSDDTGTTDIGSLFGGGEDEATDEDADVDEPSHSVWAPTATPRASGEEDDSRTTVAPEFGADLLTDTGPQRTSAIPPSFDQLIARGATPTGSQSTPHALILPETPGSASLGGPVTSTGEVLITGSYELPEGLGSIGHAPGTADNKDTDRVLVDHELPAHSSPTPIAASSAISTIKPAGEIIRPPAPEKGNKLMLTLAITAGALALALAGVLIVAIVTGVF